MRRRAVLRSFGALATVGVAGASGVTDGVPDELRWASTSRAADDGEAGTRDTAAQDLLTRRLAVPLRDRTASFALEVPRALYDHYADRPRHDGYLSYATARGNAAVVEPVTDAVRDLVETDGGGRGRAPDLAVRRAVTGLVQGLEYVPDAAIGYAEYQKYPVETLVDGAGDCEDTAALLAALLAHLGYDVALLALWDADHMAVGVAASGLAETPYAADGTAYHYQETVEPGWGLGDVPPNYADVDADVLALTARSGRS